MEQPGADRAARARARDAVGHARRPDGSGNPPAASKADHGRRSSATPPRRRRSSWRGLSRATSSTSPRRGRAIADIPMYRQRVARSAARSGQPRPVPERRPDLHRARRLARRGAVARLPRTGPLRATMPTAHGAVCDRHPAVLRSGVPSQRRPNSSARSAPTGPFGWSGYGLDGANPDAQLAATIAFVCAAWRSRSTAARAREAASAPSSSSPASDAETRAASTASRSPRAAHARSSGGCCSMPG